MSLFVLMNSSEFRYGVGPGLDSGMDGFIRLRGDGDPAPAKRHLVQFAVRVVAPEGCTEGFLLDIPGRSATVGRCESCTCKKHCCTGIEPGDGVELIRQVANDLCVNSLVDYLHRVPFTDLLNRVMGEPGGHIFDTCKRVVVDDGLDDRVERCF